MSNTIFGRTKNILKKATSTIFEKSREKRFEERWILNSPSVKVEPRFTLKEFNAKYENEALKSDSYSNHKKLLLEFPVSNGSKYYLRHTVKLGILSDDPFFHTYEPVAKTKRVTEQNYQTISEETDLLLIAFDLENLPAEWNGLGSSKSDVVRKKLVKIIQHFKSKSKKVVFYSLDDTDLYKRLELVMKEVDAVFTIQQKNADSILSENMNQNVHVLKMGINPLIHNPIGTRLHKYKNKSALYEYWDPKNTKRKTILNTFINGSVKSQNEVVLYDTKLSQNESNVYPEDLQKYLAPNINEQYKYSYLKFFQTIFLYNENKEKYFSYHRNLHHYMALGSTLISNYHSEIHNRFPNVYNAYSESEIKEILSNYNDNDIYENQMAGVRNVFKQDTIFDRFHELCSKLELDEKMPQRRIAVITEEKTEHVVSMFSNQTYPYKDLLLESELTETKKSQYDMIAFFKDEYQYGEFYLEDLANGFKYTFCDYITKDSYLHTEGIQHNYVNQVKDKYLTLFWASSFKASTLLKLDNPIDVKNGYSIDPFEVEEKPVPLSEQKNKSYKLTMIIPIYNNGLFLLNKCMQSLKRSSMFNEMEILLIDDGSTDQFTLNMVKRLSRQYDNVKSFFFNDGGSGSASRPRNKGIELMTTDYVIYLDPDNEAVCDGYAKLYKEITTNDVDLVVGNIYRVSDREMRLNYVNAVKSVNDGQEMIEGNTTKILEDSGFKVASIQALIAKKSLITDNNILMVEGAAGEDSLFFEELVTYSNKIKLVNEDIHIYYAEVEGSVVNTVTSKFFRKYMIVQQPRVNFLSKHGLLEAYSEKRFETYFKDWILEKLKLVKQNEALESVKLTCEIWDYYKDYVKITYPVVARFDELSKLKEYDKIIAEYINS
ncbi:glycosyltransferase family 2 protein [Bacillus sp. OAE603]|uniref:glycosyltransferase n=1 Tax=Gottfriedia sp. OAE603 TaxID=2663872 RepID=UPI001788F3BA